MLSLSAPTQLQEFAAHSEAVNCLQLGRKSAQVLVSGGDDARVNMWAIGKPNPILSLEGHQSAVECVSFDWNEEVVIAGSAGGQLKLWDLENSKVMRTLAGHRAGCISVDFHPFGEYFASGSLDANLKIWDIRKKNCIVTYKGHTKGIEHVRISPDGRWVVSGSQDGMVKLWDLRAGKLMSDFQHGAAVTSMDFHPCYFQLATGCADRTVRVWDLENLELLHHTPAEATGITSVRFVPDGGHLVTTCRDYLRTRTLEPEHKICDTVKVDWSNFGDLAFNSGQLVACTMSSTFVGVWLVDLIGAGEGADGDGGEGADGGEVLMPPATVGSSADTSVGGSETAGAPEAVQPSTSGVDSQANTSWTPAERDAGPENVGMPADAAESPDGSAESPVLRPAPAAVAPAARQSTEEVQAEERAGAASPVLPVAKEGAPPEEMAVDEPKGEQSPDLDVLLREGHERACDGMSARLAGLQVSPFASVSRPTQRHPVCACAEGWRAVDTRGHARRSAVPRRDTGQRRNHGRAVCVSAGRKRKRR